MDDEDAARDVDLERQQIAMEDAVCLAEGPLAEEVGARPGQERREACGCDGCLFGGACAKLHAAWILVNIGLLTPKALGLLAVLEVLDAAGRDPDFRRCIRPGSDLFRLLCAAEAALLDKPVADVIAARGAQRPEGPCQRMTYQEWARVRAGEIAEEGAVGSHWPGKSSER